MPSALSELPLHHAAERDICYPLLHCDVAPQATHFAVFPLSASPGDRWGGIAVCLLAVISFSWCGL